MSEAIRFIAFLLFMLGVWGLAAFLIYTRTSGWGWFLAAVVLIMGSTSIHLGPDSSKTAPQQERAQASAPADVAISGDDVSSNGHTRAEG